MRARLDTDTAPNKIKDCVASPLLLGFLLYLFEGFQLGEAIVEFVETSLYRWKGMCCPSASATKSS